MPGLAIISDLPKNDFLDLILELHIPYSVFPFDKIPEINENQYSGLIIFADSYPLIHPWIKTHSSELDHILSKFLEKNKPIFTEFCPIKNILSNEIITPPHIRLIVRSSDSILQKGFKQFALLEAHQCVLLSIIKKSPFIQNVQELFTFGRVIGVNSARLGFPSDVFHGISKYQSLIFATTKISNYSIMEFRPKQSWIRLIFNICKFLTQSWFELNDEELNRVLNYSDFEKRLENHLDNTRNELYSTVIQEGLHWFESSGILNGALAEQGIYEGFESSFDFMGKKKLRTNYYEPEKLAQRGDCIMDAALAYFFATHLYQNSKNYAIIAENLRHEAFTNWQYLDQSICRGFFGWFNDFYDKYVFYSDDHGRCSFNLLLMAYITKNTAWIQRAAAAVIASKQTHGQNGHRASRIDLKHFWKHRGRKWFRKRKYFVKEYGGPHYEGWTFSSLLYGAWLFQDQEIIRLIEKAFVDYMQQFPKMRIEHSVNDDFSKLLIAAVILYNATHNSVHLQYIQQIIDFFSELQDSRTGAIPEQDLFNTRHCNEKKNSMYGTMEASVYHTNEDTITDQLYSTPFLGWGLYFAVQTNQCPKALPMLNKLMDYLSSIQIRSSNIQINGAWMRAFDYSIGEYFGSNGDVGWGAYSIESGWTVGPIVSLFEMYKLRFNPFNPLSSEDAEIFRNIYQTELQVQLDLERNWQKNTPKIKDPPKK